MSKIEKVIVNGDGVLAIVWANEKFGNHVVVQNQKLDLNIPLDIFEHREDVPGGYKKMAEKDLTEFFLEILER